jgi:transcriptional regulator with XRE-family HTH domain
MWDWLSRKKGGDVQLRPDGSPYIARSMAMSAMVLENGGTEDEAIAALLSGLVEDSKILPRLVAFHFGQPVADLVSELHITPEGENWTWLDHTMAYLGRVRQCSPGAVLISLASYTHYAIADIKDLTLNGVPHETEHERPLWMLEELLEIYRDRLRECYLVEQFARYCKELDLLWNGEDVEIESRELYEGAFNPFGVCGSGGGLEIVSRELTEQDLEWGEPGQEDLYEDAESDSPTEAIALLSEPEVTVMTSEETSPLDFGGKVKQARIAGGYTGQQLAEKVGIDKTYLSKIENNKLEYPPREEVIRVLAFVLDLEPEALMFLAGKIPSQYLGLLSKLSLKYGEDLPTVLKGLLD